MIDERHRLDHEKLIVLLFAVSCEVKLDSP